MNLIFMNSMERRTGENTVTVAQITIQEDQGKLYTVWTAPDEQGNMQQDTWYEGTSWEEMHAVLKYRVAERMSIGYAPLIGMLPGLSESANGYVRKVQMLHYYSEKHSDHELYEELRKWRRERAAKEGKAPYLVATNRLLLMISAFMPQKQDELMQLPGFGENKWKSYGEDILKITEKFGGDVVFPLDWVYERIDAEDYQSWQYKQKELKFKSEADQLMAAKQMLKCVNQGKDVAGVMKEMNMSRRDVAFMLERLDLEGYDLEPILLLEASAIPAEESDRIMAAFAELGDKYLKPVMNKVYTAEQLAGVPLDDVYYKLRMMRLYFRQQAAKTSETEKAG